MLPTASSRLYGEFNTAESGNDGTAMVRKKSPTVRKCRKHLETDRIRFMMEKGEVAFGGDHVGFFLENACGKIPRGDSEKDRFPTGLLSNERCLVTGCIDKKHGEIF